MKNLIWYDYTEQADKSLNAKWAFRVWVKVNF